jgi:hypothetical protein
VKREVHRSLLPVPTVVHGDFEWNEGKAASNFAEHRVTFEEAVLAMRDPLSVDFDDGLLPRILSRWQRRRAGVSSTSYPPRAAIASGSSAPAMPRAKNDDAMKKQDEPSAESLEEMPAIDAQRFRRRPGRGHHVALSVGEIVTIEAELWSHFGSSQAVNDALRIVVAEQKKVAGS